jgi:hypothetical protein
MVASTSNVANGTNGVNSGSGQIPEPLNSPSLFGDIRLDAFGIPSKGAVPPATQGKVKSNDGVNQKKESFLSKLSKPFKKTGTSAPPAPQKSALFENNAIDRNEMKPAPIPEEEEAAYDELWKARELSADSLSRLEIQVEKALCETSSYGKVDSKLVAKLWDALERNTALVAGKYQFEDECGEPVDFKGNPIDRNQLKEQSIRNQRKIVIPETGKIQLIKSNYGNGRKNEFFPTNHVHPNRNWRVSETPSENEVGSFRHMLRANDIGIIVDFTPGNEKHEHGAYAPHRMEPQNCDQLHIICDDSANAIHGIANFKNLVLTPTDAEGAAAGEHVNVARFHVHSLATVLRRPFNRKHRANVLNQVCELVMNKMKENTDLNQSKEFNYKKGILFHGPDSNGTSAMLKTMLGSLIEIEAAFHPDKKNGLKPEEITNEFILRTAFKHAAIGRELGGPNFLQKREQFELVVEALIEHHQPHMKMMRVEQEIFEGRKVKYASRGFVPEHERNALVQELEAAKKALDERDSTQKSGTNTGSGSAASGDSAGKSKQAGGTSNPAQSTPLSTPAKTASPKSTSASENSGPSSRSELWDTLLKMLEGQKSADMRRCSETGGTIDGIAYPSATGLHYKREVNGKSEERFLNANDIAFSRGNKDSGSVNIGGAIAASACAGRSPRAFDACQDFLLKGIESGEGLFQFVSPAAHKNLNTAREKPMMRLFQEAYDARGVEGLLIGGRYKVVREPENLAVDGEDCKRMKITVIDTKSQAPTEKSIILTQAGLKFQENKLCAAEIKRADAMMEGHLSENGAIRIPTVRDPIVVSYTGIGRNATLISYRQVLARLGEIEGEAELNKLVMEVVSEGRKGRGPGFIHSAAQLEELRLAILEAYRDFLTRAKPQPQIQPATVDRQSPPSAKDGAASTSLLTGNVITGTGSATDRVGGTRGTANIGVPKTPTREAAPDEKATEEAEAAAKRDRLAHERSVQLEEQAKKRRLEAFETNRKKESPAPVTKGSGGG